MALSKAAQKKKSVYDTDQAQRAQVDSLVKVSKRNYGVQLTKNDVFTILGDYKGDVRKYVEQKKKSKGK